VEEPGRLVISTTFKQKMFTQMFFTLFEFSQTESSLVAHDTDQKSAPTDAPRTVNNHQL
jgi:hypothetical protein